MRKITEILVTHKRGRPNYGSQGAEVRCTVENPDDSLDIGETIMSVTKLIEDAWERKSNPPKEVKGVPEVKPERLPEPQSAAPAVPPKKRGRPAKVVPAAEEAKGVAVIKPEPETAADKRAAKTAEDESAAFFDEEPEGEEEPAPPNGEPVQDAFNWDE